MLFSCFLYSCIADSDYFGLESMCVLFCSLGNTKEGCSNLGAKQGSLRFNQNVSFTAPSCMHLHAVGLWSAPLSNVIFYTVVWVTQVQFSILNRPICITGINVCITTTKQQLPYSVPFDLYLLPIFIFEHSEFSMCASLGTL